jgi:hypothetical protein
LFLETGRVKFGRVAGKNRPAAFSAIGMHPEALDGHPVHRVAMGANYVEGIAHCLLSK